jgi:predicted hydrocarbon binding protein
MEEGELLHKWLETLMAGLEAAVDERTRAKVMESCGRACAHHHGDMEKARAIKGSAQEIGERLAKLNRQVLWCGSWVRDGETITSVCEECGCPLVRAGLVELSPTFCNCSRGWVKAVFETIWGRPVEVELKQAIGQGDPVCEFTVRFDERQERCSSSGG